MGDHRRGQPGNLQRAIDLILQEVRRFITEPVTAEELRDSQANYIGRLPLSLESNAGVANALLNLERFQLGLDYYQRYPELVDGCDAGANFGDGPPLPDARPIRGDQRRAGVRER